MKAIFAKTNPAFMSGVPEILILRLLADREMYGYELVQAIEVATGQAIKLGEGVVYPVLHALEESGWNVAHAARSLDLARAHVYNLMQMHGIERPTRTASSEL